MYKIGELSKICRVSVKTLRFYDAEGLLLPDNIDKFTGYRYYSASKLAICNKIMALKELGFTLDEIKKHINAKEPSDILKLICAKEAELETIRSQADERLKKLSSIKQNIMEENSNMYNIIIRSADTLRVAALRGIYGDKRDAITTADKMRKQLPESILGKRNVIINYDTEYCEKDFDLAACVEITGKLPKGCEYEDKTIMLPGEVASLVCGANELDGAYTAILRQLEELRCQITGAFYEIYYDDGTVELKVPVCKLSERSETGKNEDINLPFVNDEEVIGRWEIIDSLPTKEQFNPQKIKKMRHSFLNELYFLPDGERYWCYGWTKGHILNDCGDGTALSEYEIFTIDNEKYMFIEEKDGDWYYYSGASYTLVLKQTDTRRYTKDDIRIIEKTDYPFINYEAVLGKWITISFTEKIESFNSDIRLPWLDIVYCKYAWFKQNGEYES